ncbi:hypothetical protein KR018_008835 [Drosophila ironensis]|nr:hypothetical protein KR018_008835 [Drosophila ironensis]
MERIQGRRILLWSLALLVLAIGFRQQVSANMILCGHDLPEALDRICQYGYNRKIKRTFDLSQLNAIEDEGPEERSLMIRMLGESANQLMKTRRRRLGISDECCRKPCARSELLRYCADGPGR